MNKTILAVLDTNVLVSALLNSKSDSFPCMVVDKAISGEIVPVLNEQIIKEYEEVLHREKFNFPEKNIRRIINGLKERGVFMTPAEIVDRVLHDKDVVFYAVTMEALKENIAYLVTGNKKHFPVKPYVVTPHEFIDVLTYFFL